MLRQRACGELGGGNKHRRPSSSSEHRLKKGRLSGRNCFLFPRMCDYRLGSSFLPHLASVSAQKTHFQKCFLLTVCLQPINKSRVVDPFFDDTSFWKPTLSNVPHVIETSPTLLYPVGQLTTSQVVVPSPAVTLLLSPSKHVERPILARSSKSNFAGG